MRRGCACCCCDAERVVSGVYLCELAVPGQRRYAGRLTAARPLAVLVYLLQGVLMRRRRGQVAGGLWREGPWRQSVFSRSLYAGCKNCYNG